MIGDILKGDKKLIFNAGLEASKFYSHPESTMVPKVQLVFSPFGIPFAPIEILGDDVGKIVRSLVWTKDRNNPGGILQATITPDSYMLKKMVDFLNKLTGNIYSKIWGALGVEIEDLLKPMTMCQLWINGYHVMTGYVRSCNRSSKVSNETKEVSYSIVCEELGNLYNLATIALDFILLDGIKAQIVDSIQSVLGLTATMKGVPLSVSLQAFLQAFSLTTLQQKICLSDGFSPALRMINAPSPVGALARTSIASFMTVDDSMFELNSANGDSSVWSFLQNYVPYPWMEFFTESGGRTIVTDNLGIPTPMIPGMCYTVARSTPYSNPTIGTVNPLFWTTTLFFDLSALMMVAGGDFVIITDDIIQDKTLGVDSVNQKTIFRTTFGGGGSGGADMLNPFIKCPGPFNPFASGGIPTFGSRIMQESINNVSLESEGIAGQQVQRFARNLVGLAGMSLSANHLSNLLATWFRNQSRFREGTVTVKGMPYARPGMYCLYLPNINGKNIDNIRDIGIYYIDSLTHEYSLENESLSFNTTLNLIRGTPLPTSVAQTALLLFDWEVLPPEAGIDGQYDIMAEIKAKLNPVRGGISVPGFTIPSPPISL